MMLTIAMYVFAFSLFSTLTALAASTVISRANGTMSPRMQSEVVRVRQPRS